MENDKDLKKESLVKKFEDIKSVLDVKNKTDRKIQLEKELSDPSIWQDRAGADKLVNQLKSITEELNLVAQTEHELAQSDTDREKLKNLVNQLEVKTYFTGRYDQNNAYLSISSGTGGVDAQDWAEMLLRMYLRFAETMAWKVTILNKSAGNEAGIKNATVSIIGNLAYGYLKTEAGVHRLVRRSPFNAKNLRQTSFTLIEVIPEIDNPGVEIKDSDLKIDTFRSSGHGGQSVNTTDSAVRITHLPTGITASCQNERSQLQNKQSALKMLASKLAVLSEEKRDNELSQIAGEIKTAKWGNQIRSYVLDPYKLVKDHRTDYEETNTQKVLDGNIKEFIESYLKKSNQRGQNV